MPRLSPGDPVVLWRESPGECLASTTHSGRQALPSPPCGNAWSTPRGTTFDQNIGGHILEGAPAGLETNMAAIGHLSSRSDMGITDRSEQVWLAELTNSVRPEICGRHHFGRDHGPDKVLLQCGPPHLVTIQDQEIAKLRPGLGGGRRPPPRRVTHLVIAPPRYAKVPLGASMRSRIVHPLARPNGHSFPVCLPSLPDRRGRSIRAEDRRRCGAERRWQESAAGQAAKPANPTLGFIDLQIPRFVS